MPRQIDDWVDFYMEKTLETEPPTVFRRWVALSIIASALERKCYMMWDSFTYPNLYVALVGPSGTGKGTAMSPGRELLDHVGIQLSSDSITREALIKELNEHKVDTQYKGRPIVHCSMTIFAPELTVFLGYDNKQLMIDLTDWYDCRDRWRYRTKHQGTENMPNVWVNLIGGTTPHLLQSTLTSDAIGGGLTARFIFVYASKPAKTIIFPFNSIIGDKDFDLLKNDLEKIKKLVGQFKISDDFMDLWNSWCPTYQNVSFTDNRFEGYISRRRKHVLKLCMLYNASHSDRMVITAKDLERSIKTVEEVEGSMQMAFSGVGKSMIADLLASIMMRLSEKGPMKRSQLLVEFQHDVDLETLNRILIQMEAMNYIKNVKQKDGDYLIELLVS